MKALILALVSLSAWGASLRTIRTVELDGLYLGYSAAIKGDQLIYTPVKNFAEAGELARIVSENVETGVRKWETIIDGNAQSISLNDEIALMLTYRNSIYAIEISSGSVLWTKKAINPEGAIDRIRFEKDGQLYYTDSGTGIRERLSERTGEVLETLDIKGLLEITPTGDYLLTNQSAGGIHTPPSQKLELSKRTSKGEILWTQRDFHSPAYLFQSESTTDGGVVGLQYISMIHPNPALKRRFHSFLLNDRGEKIWSAFIQSQVHVPHRNRLVFVDEDPRTMRAVDDRTGTEIWSKSLDHETHLISHVILSNQIVIKDEKEIRIFDITTGETNATFEIPPEALSSTLMTASDSHVVLTTYNEVTQDYSMHILGE